VDQEQRLDVDVENLVVELVDDFVTNLSKSAGQICLHRQSDVLEAEDAQLIAGLDENLTDRKNIQYKDSWIWK
jgi:transcription initiation factor TFIID subunit TAF12